MRIAINGFGRIGRTALKAIISPHDWGRMQLSPLLKREEIEVAAINDLGGADETLAYLFKYDTVYGTYPEPVGVEDDFLLVGEKKLPFFTEADPGNLPWGDLEIDVVLECTGAFADFEKARAHLKAGARHVVISANAKGKGTTLVFGTDSMKVLENAAAGAPELEVVSCASCTTNAAAPVFQILHDNFGVQKGQAITVHAVTSTQPLVDAVNKNPRRSRAAYNSIIPQATGAAEAVGEAVPALKGRVSGSALRVPVLCGSIVEIIAQLEKPATAENINQIFRKAAGGNLKGVLAVTEDELVSSDIIGLPASSIVDSSLTEVVGDNLAKVVAWYDNEYGYTCRLVELAQLITKF